MSLFMSCGHAVIYDIKLIKRNKRNVALQLVRVGWMAVGLPGKAINYNTILYRQGPLCHLNKRIENFSGWHSGTNKKTLVRHSK